METIINKVNFTVNLIQVLSQDNDNAYIHYCYVTCNTLFTSKLTNEMYNYNAKRNSFTNSFCISSITILCIEFRLHLLLIYN